MINIPSNWSWILLILLMLFAYSMTIEFHFPLTGLQGDVSSPNYPHTYPLNTTCIWSLSCAKGNRIQLNITHFDLEDDKKCLYDFLMIIEHPPKRSSPRYCGMWKPPVFTTTGNGMDILFKSDNMGVAGKGFMAKWKIIEQDKQISQGSSSSICPTKTVTVYRRLPCTTRSKLISGSKDVSKVANIRYLPPVDTIKEHGNNISPSPNIFLRPEDGTHKHANNMPTPSLGRVTTNCTLSIESGKPTEELRNVMITLVCVLVILLTANIIRLVIYRRKDKRDDFTEERYLPNCPRIPDIYPFPSPGRPRIKMGKGDVIVIPQNEKWQTENYFKTRYYTGKQYQRCRSNGGMLQENLENLSVIPFHLLPPSMLSTLILSNDSVNHTGASEIADSSDLDSNY